MSAKPSSVGPRPLIASPLLPAASPGVTEAGAGSKTEASAPVAAGPVAATPASGPEELVGPALVWQLPSFEVYPRNEAVREAKPGFWARLAAWLGIRIASSRAALAAQMGAWGWSGDRPVVGAPLGDPVGVPAVEPEIAKATRRLRETIGVLSTDAITLFRELETKSALEIAKIDRAFGLGYGGKYQSLRQALNFGLHGSLRTRALELLDEALARVRRPNGEPLHDLAADPGGFRGPGIDGRLPQTVDKVLELRRLGCSSRADLVNHHEMTAGNIVKVLAGARRAFDEVLEAIDDAQKFVHVGFFIFKDDERGRILAEKLIEKQAQGVKVRVTFDESGDLLALASSARRLMEQLEEGGVEVACNYIVDAERETSLINAPDHRKMVIVDGKVAFTGGMNVGKLYIEEWQDHFLRLEGPAVHQLGVEYLTNWLGLGKEIDRGASDAEVRARYFPPVELRGQARVKVAQSIPGQNDEILRSYVEMIRRADTEIWIESPYISSPIIQEELLRAVRDRHVDVHILIPGENNHPSCEHAARPGLRRLLRAGAHIYAFDGMNHAKVMTIDHHATILGTANLDDLSLHKVYEVNLHIDDLETTARIQHEIFCADLARSKPLGLADLDHGSPFAEALWGALTEWI